MLINPNGPRSPELSKNEQLNVPHHHIEDFIPEGDLILYRRTIPIIPNTRYQVIEFYLTPAFINGSTTEAIRKYLNTVTAAILIRGESSV